MFNSIKSSDQSFTNVLINRRLNVQNNCFLQKTNVLQEIHNVNDSLVSSQNKLDQFKHTLQNFDTVYQEFQKNRILTTQDMDLESVELLDNEHIDIDLDKSYIKIVCEDALINCDIHLYFNSINTRFVYVKLPFPVLHQNFETEGISQSQIIPGRIAIKYNNLTTTLSSAYIDIGRFTNYVIIDSPFFTDTSIGTQIEADVCIRYSGDISSKINTITPMRNLFEHVYELNFTWYSPSLTAPKALLKWVIIKNKIDIFIEATFTVNSSSFYENTRLIGKLPFRAYKTNVDMIYNAIVSTTDSNYVHYAVKPAEIMLKSKDQDNFYIHLPNNIMNVTDNLQVNVCGYFSYYNEFEVIHDIPYVINYDSHYDNANVTFSNIDIYDSLNIYNAMFFDDGYNLNFNIFDDGNIIDTHQVINFDEADLTNNYVFSVPDHSNLSVNITISNKTNNNVISSNIHRFPFY